jgi:heme-degrading monooxygenase HmoA
VYALVRKAKLATPDSSADVVRRVREGVLPILKEQHGFRSHFGFVSEACEAVAVTLSADRESGKAAHERVRAWVAAKMQDVMAGPPEVCAGEVLYYDEVALRRRQQNRGASEDSLFVTIREYEGVGPNEEVIPLIHEHTFPLMQRQPGLQSFCAFRDETKADRAVSVSVWSSRDTAIAAHQRMLEAMVALRHVIPSPPKVTAGAARVIAAARPVLASM